MMSTEAFSEMKKQMKYSKELDMRMKYHLYESSVQCPSFDVDFIAKTYKNFYKRIPGVVREDFCGTGLFCCEWVKKHPNSKAIGIDLDPSPMDFGKKHHLSRLTSEQLERVTLHERNVLDAQHLKSDVVLAFNFSYFIFKQRDVLLKYFKDVRKSLNKDGLFLLDIFGGTECLQELEEETEYDDFTYYWDCDRFNPITSECLYHIHFKLKGVKEKFEGVFTYDWRMWSIPEIKDLLAEAGFSNIDVFWEGDDDDGGGDGDYSIVKEEDNCESWVAYIAARP